jgi:hypothetical protein
MSIAEQMPYVTRFYRFLSPAALRMAGESLDNAYLAVFASGSVGRGPDAVVYEAPSANYKQNRELDRDGDGTIRVHEAVAPVRAILAGAKKRVELPPPTAVRDNESVAVFGGTLLLLLGAWLLHLRNRRRGMSS